MTTDSFRAMVLGLIVLLVVEATVTSRRVQAFKSVIYNLDLRSFWSLPQTAIQGQEEVIWRRIKLIPFNVHF